MRFPTLDEFKIAVLTRPLDSVVREFLFEGDPFAFKDKPQTMEMLRDHLASQLRVSKSNIVVIGSAKIGFSLSPHNFPRQFSDDSDIDVMVIDTSLFDTVWQTMLLWNYPRRYRLIDADWRWAKKRRDDLYWGWFVPDHIRYDGLSFPNALKPLRNISSTWFNAFRSLGRYEEFANRDISGRLYRTWDHALLYHSDGLRQIRDELSKMG